MSELLPTHETLWFEGMNHTADAVIIDESQQHILLIQRRSGQWALPGGFLDEGESSYEAAMREAFEESTIEVMNGQLIFGGIVDDPRNTSESWIETHAYLFTASTDKPIRANSDARDARWHPINNLPDLYASHQSIVNRAIDYLQSVNSLHQFPADSEPVRVTGGHMNYAKSMIISSDQSLFIKSYDSTDDGFHITALQKESAIMGHLRTLGYPHLPAFSHIADTDLFMEAMPPDHGWQWRAPKDATDKYIRDCLNAFTTLESMPIPADTTDIPSSIASYYENGWRSLSETHFDEIVSFVDNHTSLLRPESIDTVTQLLRDLPTLRQRAITNPRPDSYVFCHHDARQANIAWHPDHGVKMVDWSWADIGHPGSDATMLLIDLHKHGHDISDYHHVVSADHCVTLMGFWLHQAIRPIGDRDPSIRLQQFVSALSAYEVLVTYEA
jgi:8-oxo-dGTP diphosphatase